MGALTNLWNSERGLLALVLVIIAGALAWQGRMTIPEWKEFTQWIFVTYAAAKTVTGSFAIVKGSVTDPKTGSAPAAPPAA